MKTVSFNYKSVHRMVSEQQRLGNDVKWEGWDVVFFRPAEHAIYTADGAFKNGGYGFENRVVVNAEGKWEVDTRNLRGRGNRPRGK